jgi:hypothetical protein
MAVALAQAPGWEPQLSFISSRARPASAQVWPQVVIDTLRPNSLMSSRVRASSGSSAARPRTKSASVGSTSLAMHTGEFTPCRLKVETIWPRIAPSSQVGRVIARECRRFRVTEVSRLSPLHGLTGPEPIRIRTVERIADIRLMTAPLSERIDKLVSRHWVRSYPSNAAAMRRGHLCPIQRTQLMNNNWDDKPLSFWHWYRRISATGDFFTLHFVVRARGLGIIGTSTSGAAVVNRATFVHSLVDPPLIVLHPLRRWGIWRAIIIGPELPRSRDYPSLHILTDSDRAITALNRPNLLIPRYRKRRSDPRIRPRAISARRIVRLGQPQPFARVSREPATHRVAEAGDELAGSFEQFAEDREPAWIGVVDRVAAGVLVEVRAGCRPSRPGSEAVRRPPSPPASTLR